MSLPRTAYILLWFPKPSETFVFREVVNLRKMGLPLKVFALYGELTDGMSQEMRAESKDVERLGLPGLKSIAADVRVLVAPQSRAHCVFVPHRAVQTMERG